MKKRISLGVITLMLLMSVCNICFSQQIEGSVSIVQDQQNNGLVSYPSDTKSPRTTLESFLYLTQCYYDFIKTDGFTSENIEELISISNQIVKLFDLRNVAPSFREDVAMEAAVFLREALDRVDLPPMKDVPDEEKMSKAIHDGKVPFYRIPGTMIDIERISEGTYAGHYQFTSDTLKSAKIIYEQADERPIKNKKMDGFYEAYFLTPGPAIPLNWIRTLPAWTMEEYLGQTIWQWIFLFVIIALVLGFLFFVYWLTSLYVGKRNSIAANMILLLRPIITICLLLFSVSFLDEQIFLTGEVLQVIVFIVNIIVLYCSIAITLVLSKILASSNIFLKGSKQGEVNQHLVSIGIRLIGIAVAIIILIHGLHKLGFSLATILTGASVTGLALALAAQSTLKNIFGSIMLLVDEPFVVGDRIKIDKHDGYVEEIGLRSTRLRTVLGNLVTIPNEELASADIENITKRKYVRRKFNVTITYNTPPEKVKRAIFILKEILSVPENILEQKQNALQKKDKKALKELDHPNMRIVSQEHPVQVFFNDFNADSLNLIVYYWFKTEDYWEYLQHAQWVNQQILERFNDEKIEFAFPTQTIFLEQDKSL